MKIGSGSMESVRTVGQNCDGFEEAHATTQRAMRSEAQEHKNKSARLLTFLAFLFGSL
jgi:hypothetical protein